MNATANSSNSSFTPLVDHLLIAMPQLQDSYFANTVVYIWRHDPGEGALGLVVNLPIRMQLWEVLDQLKLDDRRPRAASQIVLSGGPVETAKGFVLHDDKPRWPSSLAITESLTLTASRDILADIGTNSGPERFIVALGYASWSPGQLERELRDNTWFTCRAQSDIIFSTDFARKPEMAAATLGFSMSQLATDVGYS
ncbi:MAG: YqgE/AlgH family protein [Pseudomonadales bacterium]|jgi:putative transcriptional regulator|nr:YqgE/AlgH family protein [Pseudomonadales bacterium]